MAEDWRRKAYYRTRVLIPVDECLASEFGDCVICLTGGQLNLVRNLLLYAERRSSFVSEYHDDHYLAPTAAEWDDLQAMVSHLEGNLMDCEQFSNDIAELLERVRALTATGAGPWPSETEDDFPYSSDVGDDEISRVDAAACAVAQLWYQWGYEVITEYVLPASRWGFDTLVPAIAGFIALAIGGPAAALGVYTVSEFVQELLELFYRGAETNLINWMDSNKEDIICAIYSNMRTATQDASEIWSVVYASVVSPAEDISIGDKLMLNLFMGSWAGSNADRAYTENTQWAQDNVSVGYCSVCPGTFEFSYEWYLPPHTNWELSASKSEWTPEGYFRGWQGVGSGAQAPPVPVPCQGTFDMKIEIHSKGNSQSPDSAIYIKKSDNPAYNWWTNPEFWGFYMNAPDGTWSDQEYNEEMTLDKDYFVMFLVGLGTDAAGITCDYLKITFTPQP